MFDVKNRFNFKEDCAWKRACGRLVLIDIELFHCAGWWGGLVVELQASLDLMGLPLVYPQSVLCKVSFRLRGATDKFTIPLN